MTEVVLFLVLIFNTSQTSNGFGAGPEKASKMAKKVSYGFRIL